MLILKRWVHLGIRKIPGQDPGEEVMIGNRWGKGGNAEQARLFSLNFFYCWY